MLAGGSGFALIVLTIAFFVDVFFADAAPGTAILFEQVLAFRWPPRTRGIIGEATSGQGMPDVDDRLDDAPAGLDHVRALKQCGIANHAIAQQSFVTSAVFHAEIRTVVKIHVDQAELHYGAGNFSAET